MDKIWDRKSFEVRGHWPLWRGWKKRMTTQKRQKSIAKKRREYFAYTNKILNLLWNTPLKKFCNWLIVSHTSTRICL